MLYWYWNEFLPKYLHLNGLKLSNALEEFPITLWFLGSKMQKSTFWNKNRFNWSASDNKPILPTWKKHTNTLSFAYYRLFRFFLKKFIFCLFCDFRKSSAAHTKIIVRVLLYVHMLDKHITAWSAHFLAIFLRLVSTSGFNVKLWRSFKWHM